MHQRREAVVALILGSVLLGCNVVPHIQSNPNVALIDTEHHEEDEFVAMQEPVKNDDPPTNENTESGDPAATRSVCMHEVQTRVVATRERNWTQARIDAAISQCMNATPKR